MAEMRVDVRVLMEDQKYWHLNKKLMNQWPNANDKPGKASQLKCVPNTGATVTCARPALLQKLNLASSSLIPTSQTTVAANNKSLHIMGAVMVEVRVEKEGKEKFMKQFCYICKEVTGLYLSLSACKDLNGVLQWNKDNSPLGVNGVKKVEGDKEKEATCDCPARSKPPLLPYHLA